MLSTVGRPREHDQTTAAALLDAAEHQLRAGGLESTSLRTIAEEAGVSVRAVYSLFGDRRGLVDALAVRAFGQLADRVEAIEPGEDPDADLLAAALTFRRVALEHPELYRLAWERVFTAELGTRPEWAREGERARRAALAHLGRALAPEATDPNDLGQFLPAFHALCQGLTSCEVNGVFAAMGVTDVEAVWRGMLGAWLTGVRAAATVAS